MPLTRFRGNVVPLVAREWDRLTIATLFIAFGVADAITPDLTPLAQMLEWFRIAQFILAGVLLFVGVLRKSYLLRGAGTILYASGLATIAVIVIFGSGSTTLLLIAAFALQGFADLRRLRAKNSREWADDVVSRVIRREGG